jgi:CRP-like cAMP-binding protein/CheY-like chemotaxis protein
MHRKASADRSDVSVIVADPAIDQRKPYGDYLTHAGCRVTFASDSDAALAQSLSMQPDVITLSHRLHPLDGPQCCQRLKSDGRTTAIPVIILTTTTNVAELRSAHDAGCEALLIQPVSPEDLFRTIREAVGRAKQLVARAQTAAARSRTIATRTIDEGTTRRAMDLIAPATLGSMFDARRFLDSRERGQDVTEYGCGDVIYSQGDRCDVVLYVRKGAVKLSVVSKAGHEAVVGLLSHGDFFGEGCLIGQPVRLGHATSIAASTIVRVEKAEMRRLLHDHRDMSNRFIAHMLSRNLRVEEDLVDQLFNSSEKRLARALLLLARYGKQDKLIRSIPRMSQGTLAEMVGTTRSRVNFFMKKFERLGFIEYKNGLKVNKGLLTVVLHD